MQRHRNANRFRRTSRRLAALSSNLSEHSSSSTPDITTSLARVHHHNSDNSSYDLQYGEQSFPTSSTSLEPDSDNSNYTYRIYNRFKGAWEDKEPEIPPPSLLTASHNEGPYDSDEVPSITHVAHRAAVCEYHRLQIYTNDTDSSYSPSNDSDSDSTGTFDTSDINDTDSNHSSITCELEPHRLRPPHPSQHGSPHTFDIDSTGDFPSPFDTTSDSTFEQYATQSEVSATSIHYPDQPNPMPRGYQPRTLPSITHLDVYDSARQLHRPTGDRTYQLQNVYLRVNTQKGTNYLHSVGYTCESSASSLSWPSLSTTTPLPPHTPSTSAPPSAPTVFKPARTSRPPVLNPVPLRFSTTVRGARKTVARKTITTYTNTDTTTTHVPRKLQPKARSIQQHTKRVRESNPNDSDDCTTAHRPLTFKTDPNK